MLFFAREIVVVEFAIGLAAPASLTLRGAAESTRLGTASETSTLGINSILISNKSLLVLKLISGKANGMDDNDITAESEAVAVTAGAGADTGATHCFLFLGRVVSDSDDEVCD